MVASQLEIWKMDQAHPVAANQVAEDVPEAPQDIAFGLNPVHRVLNRDRLIAFANSQT